MVVLKRKHQQEDLFVILQKKDRAKYLGVQIDNSLNWKEHMKPLQRTMKALVGWP